MKKLILALMLLAIPAQAADLTKITFCRPNNMISSHAYIAEHEGYFKDEGLDVNFITATNAKICNDNLVAGHADAMFGAEGPFTWLSFNKNPLHVITEAGKQPVGFIARRDSGIKTEADIRGKRIGYLPGTVSYLYLVRLLDKLGMTLKDVNLVALQPPAMPQALQGKAIDGFVVWEPWINQAVKAVGEKNVILFSDSKLYTQHTISSVTTSFATKNPEAVKALLRSYIKAEDFIKTHPEKAIPILAEAVKLDEQVIRHIWKDCDFTIGFSHTVEATLNENARYIIRDDPNFAGQSIPNYRQYLAPEYLKAVAPERVTLKP